MKLLGLTGGIGMGKSTVSLIIAHRGVHAIDTDDIAKELVRPRTEALDKIAKAFGPKVLNKRGELVRSRLGKIVFGNKDARLKLEAIMHPRIRTQWQERVNHWQKTGIACGVVVIPLLFETGCGDIFDDIICAACSAQTQRTRLLARGWPITHIDQRLAAQWTIERKIEPSDFVVWTEGDKECVEAQVDTILSS